MTRTSHLPVAAAAAALAVLAWQGPHASAAAKAVTKAKAGAKCTTAGAVSGTMTCTTKAGRLVWAKTTTAPTTLAAASATPTTVNAGATGGAATTTPPSGASDPAPTGIEGTWKATNESQVGYRVKEIIEGQSTEGVGRTSAVTGTLTIVGTKATTTELTVDMTTMKSDQPNRDREFHGRIMDTDRFRTATLKLTTPVDFGKVPVDKEQISAKAKASLMLRGTTKPVDVDLAARRNGSKIEVQGSLRIVFADWGIPAPSNAVAKTEDDGELEFLVVFAR